MATVMKTLVMPRRSAEARKSPTIGGRGDDVDTASEDLFDDSSSDSEQRIAAADTMATVAHGLATGRSAN